jgi:hypothetical protein
MALLHAARERERPRRPITVLIAEAVRSLVENESQKGTEHQEVNHAETRV